MDENENETIPEAPLDDDALAAMDEALADGDDEQDEAPAVEAADEESEQEPEQEAEPERAEAPEKDVEAEISDLKLGERSAARFREMSGEIRELRSALEQAGVKDVAELPAMLQKAKTADDLVAMVMETGATAEQYGQTLDYLRLVNGALAGDREATEKAFAVVEKEYKALAQALGRKVDGVDPLEGHDDLREKVEDGYLSEDDALEIARARSHQAAMQAQQQTVQQQTQQQQAVEQGRNALAAWDQQMLQADPSYASKRDALSAQVAVIRAQLPPDRWLQATQQLYATLPNLQPAVPAKPAPGPVRPRATPALRRDFETPEEAMEYALNTSR